MNDVFDIKFSYSGTHYNGNITALDSVADRYFSVSYKIAGGEDESEVIFIEKRDNDPEYANPSWDGTIGFPGHELVEDDEFVLSIGEQIERHLG